VPHATNCSKENGNLCGTNAWPKEIARQDKLAAKPLSASSRTSDKKDAMAPKQARAGKLSKANQTVFSVLKPAFGHNTLHKLQEKTPFGSVVFDKQFWPTTDALDEMRRHDG